MDSQATRSSQKPQQAVASQAAAASAGGGKAKTWPLMSRSDVEALIAEGRKVLIFEQHVLRVDPWIKYHPGGDLSILHMVGKDATDEITAYVVPPCPYSYDVNWLGTRLPKFNRGS